MTDHRWTWGTALVVPIALGSIWLMQSDEPAPAEGGIIQIAGAPSPAIGAAPTQAAPARLTSEDNGKAARLSQRIVVHEPRDAAWAARSEAALERLMRGIPAIGRGQRLTVTCTTTVCEVSGLAPEDPATGRMDPLWTTLEAATGGDALRAAGLERTSTIFGTGRVREEFMIYFRRVDGAVGG